AVGRGIRAGLSARPGFFVAVTGGVVGLSIMLPPIVLSVARKPWTYFAFNPWLKSLPTYLASDKTLAEKLDFLSRVALFWFAADGPYGHPEWGFAVDTVDLARMLVTGLLVGTHFSLWLYLHDQTRPPRWRASACSGGGALGAAAGVLGLS